LKRISKVADGNLQALAFLFERNVYVKFFSCAMFLDNVKAHSAIVGTGKNIPARLKLESVNTGHVR